MLVLRHPNFRRLVFANSISTIGNSLNHLLLLLIINEQTGQAGLVALLAIVRAAPRIVFGFFAGLLADTVDRKRIILASDIVSALTTLAFIPAIATGNLWLIYVIAFLQSSIEAFSSPARSAVTVNTVPKKNLMQAFNFLESTTILASVVGTTVAGVLFSLNTSYGLTFSLDAITFLASFMILYFLQGSYKTIEEDNETPTFFRGLGEGVKVVLQHRVLTGAVLSGSIIMLGLGAFNALYVPLLSNEVMLPGYLFGAAELVENVGTIIAGLCIAILSAKLRPTRIIVVSLVLLGASIVALSQAQALWFVFVMLLTFGLTPLPINVALSTLVQSVIEDRVRGRVIAFFDVSVTVFDIASMILAGLLTGILSTRSILFLAGLTILFAAAVSSFLFRQEKGSHNIESTV